MSTETPPVHAVLTQVQVSILPEGHPARDYFAVTVDYRGRGSYAVMRWGRALGADGEWDYEPRPSSREDGWKAAHRFSYDEAMQLAVQHAPKVTCNGRTALEVLNALPVQPGTDSTEEETRDDR